MLQHFGYGLKLHYYISIMNENMGLWNLDRGSWQDKPQCMNVIQWWFATLNHIHTCYIHSCYLHQTLFFSWPQKNRRTLCPTASWNGFMIVLAFISRTSASNQRSTQWRRRSHWVQRGEEEKATNCRCIKHLGHKYILLACWHKGSCNIFCFCIVLELQS